MLTITDDDDDKEDDGDDDDGNGGTEQSKTTAWLTKQKNSSAQKVNSQKEGKKRGDRAREIASDNRDGINSSASPSNLDSSKS